MKRETYLHQRLHSPWNISIGSIIQSIQLWQWVPFYQSAQILWGHWKSLRVWNCHFQYSSQYNSQNPISYHGRQWCMMVLHQWQRQNIAEYNPLLRGARYIKFCLWGRIKLEHQCTSFICFWIGVWEIDQDYLLWCLIRPINSSFIIYVSHTRSGSILSIVWTMWPNSNHPSNRDLVGCVTH